MTAAVWVLVLILNGGTTINTSLHFTKGSSCENAAAQMQGIGNGSALAYATCVKMKDLAADQ